jgi:glucose-6-phosphate-specific signal transduction histidine kinase
LGESSALLINKSNATKNIKLKVIGYVNNRNAIGSKIYAFDNTSEKPFWYDEITAGSGYMSANDFTKIIPIQKQQTITLKIVYPNGIVKAIENIKPGTSITVEDAGGYSKQKALIKQKIKLYLFNHHNRFELFKWLLVIFLIFYFGRLFYQKYNWPIYKILFVAVFFLSYYYLQSHLFEYKGVIYGTILPLGSLTLFATLIYYYQEKKYVQQLANIEQLKLKNKISRNLHDDLAATVSSIGFYLTLIDLELGEGKKSIKNWIKKSEELLQNATNTITDLIWSYQTNTKTLEDVLQRLKNYYQPIFNERNIEFKINIPEQLIDYTLSKTQKEHLYLLLKEALNNTLKYANADKVIMNVSNQNHYISINIKDNGKGFEFDEALKKGNGLTNMIRRAKDMNGSIDIETSLDKGVQINVNIPFKK